MGKASRKNRKPTSSKPCDSNIAPRTSRKPLVVHRETILTVLGAVAMSALILATIAIDKPVRKAGNSSPVMANLSLVSLESKPGCFRERFGVDAVKDAVTENARSWNGSYRESRLPSAPAAPKINHSASTAPPDVSYTYDALGRRVSKTVTSDIATTTTVFVSAGHQEIAEYAAGAPAASPERKYVYGSYIDEPVLFVDRTAAGTVGAGIEEPFYYHANPLHSVTAMTDSTGSVVERYAYDAYGAPAFLDASATALTPQASTIGQPNLFTGRRFDAETGLHYFRARYFDSTLGRFISRDPIGYVDGLSLYNGYFAPNGMDPFGLADDYAWYNFPGWMTDPIASQIHHLFDSRGAKLDRILQQQQTDRAVGDDSLPHNLRGVQLSGAKDLMQDADTLARLSIEVTASGMSGGFLRPSGAASGVGKATSKIDDTAEATTSKAARGESATAEAGSATRRVSNPKHHPNSCSPEPSNVQELWDNAIVDEKGRRWAKDSDGIIHRFSPPSNGESHWNGATKGNDPIRMESIPKKIRRALE